MNYALKIPFVVLKRRKYAFIALVVASATGILSYYLTVMRVYQKSISIYAEMNGLGFTAVSLFFSFLIAILFGIYIVLLIFRRKIIKSRSIKNKAVGLGAISASIIVSGCPSCGMPVLALFGSPLALLALPFKGIEIKFLSIFLLILSIILISKNIKSNLACEPEIKKI